jgi:hypothetical protein
MALLGNLSSAKKILENFSFGSDAHKTLKFKTASFMPLIYF